MVRKLALVMVMLAATLPGWVQALGLGEIQLNSFLNQPLSAEIEVFSSQRGEVDGLKISLASPAAFERAGLEYSNILRQLKFKLIKKGGKNFIKVTTRKGYREPFLSFLLEVNWASGRILREYAALVDPPSLVKSTPSQTRTSTASTQYQAPRKAKKSSSIKAAPQQPLYGGPDDDTDSGLIGDKYTTKRNDTAWKIARDVRTDDQATVEQAMMAILRANPNAFIGNNINRLKAGYELQIPDAESMRQLTNAQAKTEIRRQTQAWRNRGTTTASSRKGRLEILPPKSGTAATGSSGTATPKQGDLHREAMLARESAEAQRQENAELRLRVSELEAQIKNSKRLATLKAQQLAQLEKKLTDLNSGKGKTAPVTPAPAEPAAPAEPVPPVVATTTEAPAPGTTEAPVPATDAPAKPKAVVEAKPAGPGSPVNSHIVKGFEPVDIDKLPKSKLPAKPFKTEAATTAPVTPASDAGIVDKTLAYFKANPTMMWVAIGSGGILILLVIMLMFRRGSDDDFEESILQERAFAEETAAFDEGTETEAEADKFFETVDADEETVIEKKSDDLDSSLVDVDTSFLSDMVLSDMSESGEEGGESDPLTEADVFLAYGRFGPAENMIKGAIAKEPERNDLRLKLLEIYYSAKNKDSFESEAADFNAVLADKPDADTWDKVVEMGMDLCPDNTLFTDTPTPVVEKDLRDAADEIDAEVNELIAEEDGEDTAIMDFDLSEFEDQIDAMDSENTVKQEPEEDTGLDLDLGELSGEKDTNDDTMEITAELEGLADVLKPDDEETLEKPLDITEEFESNVVSLEPEITQEIEVPDLASELGLDATDESTVPMDNTDLDDSDLDDIDEVGTKLDLARAYIDMGDPEGAKSILEEVAEEGDDAQKSEAQELMKKI